MKKSHIIQILLIAIFACVTQQAHSITITQTLEFSEIRPFGSYVPGNGNFTELKLKSSDWSSSAFPFELASEIESINFLFSSSDPYFNSGIGPNGGNVGVEIGIILNDTGDRKGLVSVVTGNQSPTFFHTTDPQQRFTTIVDELLDGELIISLGAFEGFSTHSLPLTLYDMSTLKVSVTGTVPEPATLSLIILGLFGICFRRRANRLPLL